MSKESNTNNDLETTHSYSRAQALEDGALIDVSEAAKKMGFTMPVALTAAAHASYVTAAEQVNGQGEAERLGDILWMLLLATVYADSNRNELGFGLLVRNPDDGSNERVILKAAFEPDDTPNPALTVRVLGES